jgi:O-6-methylguanine DNA methyltransferase
MLDNNCFSNYISCIKTPLGDMVALSGEDAVYLLEFADHTDLENKMEKAAKGKLAKRLSLPIKMLQEELALYFQENLKVFRTPVVLSGSPFQNAVWKELIEIPLGETRSYSEIAERCGNLSAVRAVANSIGANPLAIIVPCHRVIQKNGGLGGYSGGLHKKTWLLQHEKAM